jgi:hypothetical protein
MHALHGIPIALLLAAVLLMLHMMLAEVLLLLCQTAVLWRER